MNPNSIDNVCMVLDHIQRISGINKGERKWIAVTCDGVPYNYAQKFKKKRFSWNSFDIWPASRRNEYVKIFCEIKLV